MDMQLDVTQLHEALSPDTRTPYPTPVKPAANDLCLQPIQAPREQDGFGPRFPGPRQLSIFPSHQPLTLHVVCWCVCLCVCMKP